MSYSSVVLADGPDGYWRLNETSGATFADSSGHGRNLTMVNSPTLSGTSPLQGQGTGGKSSLFNGTTQGAYIAGSTFHYSIPFSLECWMITTGGTDANWWGLFSCYNNFGYFLDAGLHTAHKLTWYNGGPSTGYVVSSATSIDDGKWHHVVLTNDTSKSNVIKIYVDGQLDASGTSSGNMTASDGSYTGIAYTPDRGLGYYHGSMAEAAAYPMILTADQVLNHYRHGLDPVAGAIY